ncbi:ANTAR domain-containing protein [Jatrophihabitans sp.]|uniref:ANTAR domain-containing protein n=1 Tax=Jatrophihabitans sp. TaxID=1932789 RepID=UPI002C0A813D|nr:GAF and ANTAR domain-containing protein [Jatrophihabitans sp.]
MTTELSEFLADLGSRRQRLLQLVRPDEPAALIEELTELGEQLMIAEEELRVQQEELAAADARMRALMQEREELCGDAAQPYLLTDRRGVVLRANPAAYRLIRQPAIRTTPRPVATWFEVADRPAIRTMISRLASGQDGQAEGRAVLVRADRSTLAVHVTVTATTGADPTQLELLWRLEAEPTDGEPPDQHRAEADPPVALRLVPEPAEAAVGERAAPVRYELADDLVMLAVELAGCETEEHLLSVAVEEARRLVPHAEHAALLLPRRRGQFDRVESAGGPGVVYLRQEIDLREGPTFAALAGPSPVLVADTRSETRWKAFAAATAGAGARSVLSVSVSVSVPAGDRVLGALSVYACRPNAFDTGSAAAASMLAIQLGLSLDHLRTVHNLRAGLASRAEIGEAMGVLMERHRVTREMAFQMLVRASQHNNVKLHEIARNVSETGENPRMRDQR